MRLPLSTRLGLLLVLLLLALLPVAFGACINETSPPATEKFLAGRCTRYCEHHGCPHATPANSPAFFRLLPLYVATI